MGMRIRICVLTVLITVLLVMKSLNNFLEIKPSLDAETWEVHHPNTNMPDIPTSVT